MNSAATSRGTGAALGALLLTIVTFAQIVAVPPAVAATAQTLVA